MKQTLFIILCLFSLTSCSKDQGKVEDFEQRHDIVLSKSQLALLDNGNAFAFNLLKELYPKEDKQELFTSPFSLQVAFSMLSNGAKGETYRQIADVLGFGGCRVAEINDTYNTLIPALYAADKSTQLAIANAMWADNSFPLLESFAGSLRDNYSAEVGNIDFSSPGALNTINSWADKHTNGMIPKILDETDPDWVYIIANALYFKGVWSNKFQVGNTRKENFHCIGGEIRPMDFMHGEIPCKYAYDNEVSAAVCELPFGNKAFALDIILPDDGIDFGKFVQNFTNEDWRRICDQLHPADEYVIIPKLDLKYSGAENIIESLKALGMNDAFSSSEADFSGMSNMATYVSDVFQKARFKMDEKGAEAAAVSVIVGMNTSAGPSGEFFADHPFVFAIRETSTNAILFLGAFRGL